MTPEQIAAVQEVRAAYADIEAHTARRLRLARAFAAARNVGVPQRALVDDTGYGREQVRRLTIAARAVQAAIGLQPWQVEDMFALIANKAPAAEVADVVGVDEAFVAAALDAAHESSGR